MPRITKVETARAEGPTALCTGMIAHKDMASAQAWINSQLHTFASLGYDKVDFIVHWDDGSQYAGRIDCVSPKNPSYEWGCNSLARHIRGHVGWNLSNWELVKGYVSADAERLLRGIDSGEYPLR